MGQSRMERFPKQWKHLQWRWTKAFLSVARVVRLCSTGLGSTCIKSCYYPIYCNPFAMSGLGFLLRSPCLTCTMGRSDGRKERCDCSLLMSLCGCVVLSTASPLVSYSSSKECVQGECRGERLVLGQLQTYYHTVRRVWI